MKTALAVSFLLALGIFAACNTSRVGKHPDLTPPSDAGPDANWDASMPPSAPGGGGL